MHQIDYHTAIIESHNVKTQKTNYCLVLNKLDTQHSQMAGGFCQFKAQSMLLCCPLVSTGQTSADAKQTKFLNYYLKVYFPSSVASVRCLTFTVQNDICTELDTRSLFTHLSQDDKILCAHKVSL